jgi:hypothetical protein
MTNTQKLAQIIEQNNTSKSFLLFLFFFLPHHTCWSCGKCWILSYHRDRLSNVCWSLVCHSFYIINSTPGHKMTNYRMKWHNRSRRNKQQREYSKNRWQSYH